MKPQASRNKSPLDFPLAELTEQPGLAPGRDVLQVAMREGGGHLSLPCLGPEDEPVLHGREHLQRGAWVGGVVMRGPAHTALTYFVPGRRVAARLRAGGIRHSFPLCFCPWVTKPCPRLGVGRSMYRCGETLGFPCDTLGLPEGLWSCSSVAVAEVCAGGS